MKRRIIAMVLAAVMAWGMYTPSVAAYDASDFSDVAPDHWAYSAIMELTDLGIIHGTGSGQFSPDSPLTVGAFLALVGRALYPDEVYEDSSDWWRAYYRTAEEKGIVTAAEFSATASDMAREITRNEMARILVRADETVNGNAAVTSDTSRITDYDAVSADFRSFAAQAYTKGLLTGDEHGNFNGASTLRRDESAMVIKRLMEAKAERASANDRKTIYLIGWEPYNPYWHVITAGARQAGDDLGCDVIVCDSSLWDEIDEQAALLRHVASDGADAIVIAPLDREAMAVPISEVYSSGIPVVLVSDFVYIEDYSAAYLTDNYQAGMTAAKALYDKLKAAGADESKEGVIAVTIGSAGSQILRDRIDGFKNWWDANAPKNWKVLWDEVKVNDGDLASAMAFGQEFIAEYPSLIGLFAPNNGSTAGFALALEASGRTDIAMVGFDFSAEVEALIRNPDFHVASLLHRQYHMGYDAVAKAFELSCGGSAIPKVVDTGFRVVDRDNVDSAEIEILVRY